jgi:hypothetical protein
MSRSAGDGTRRTSAQPWPRVWWSSPLSRIPAGRIHQHLPRELNATSIGCGDGSISKVTPCWLGLTLEACRTDGPGTSPAELEHERRRTPRRSSSQKGVMSASSAGAMVRSVVR